MRRFRLGLRLLVAVLCAAALLQAMRPAVHSARQGVKAVRDTGGESSAVFFHRQLEYLSEQLRQRVPAGTRAVVSVEDPEYRLRLMELATLHGIVVVVDGADLELLLAFDPAVPHGVRLVTRKPGA